MLLITFSLEDLQDQYKWLKLAARNTCLVFIDAIQVGYKEEKITRNSSTTASSEKEHGKKRINGGLTANDQ